MYYSLTFSTTKPTDVLYFEPDTRLYTSYNITGRKIKNTWNDWHLVPTQRPAMAPPEVETHIVDVPGMNGQLDLSEKLAGHPVYKKRSGSIDFLIYTGMEHWDDIYRSMCSYLHGKELYMAYEEDPSYYYHGRFTVEKYNSAKDFSGITINYELEPFKYEYGDALNNWDVFNFDTDDRYGFKYDVAEGKRTIHDLEINTPNYIPICVNEQWGNYTEMQFVPSFQINRRPDAKSEDTYLKVKFVNHELNIEYEREFQGTGIFKDPKIIFSQNNNTGKVMSIIDPLTNEFKQMPVRYGDMEYDTLGGMELYFAGNCTVTMIATTGRL